MRKSFYLGWLAFAVTIVAVMFIGDKDIRGQYLMAFAQVLWAAWAFGGRHWPAVLQSVVLFALTLRAIILWAGAA